MLKEAEMDARHKRWMKPVGLLGLLALVGWDVSAHQVTTIFVGPADSQQDGEEPLQVDGLPLLRPGTLTLGEGDPTVAIAASIDQELSETASLDATLSFEQVDAI